MWCVVGWVLGVVGPSADDRWRMEDRFSLRSSSYAPTSRYDFVDWVDSFVEFLPVNLINHFT